MKVLSLISRCLKNERKAQFELYNRYVDTVALTCQRYSNDASRMEDNVQKTFIKIFSHLATFDIDKASFETWIKKIAVNECLMENRKHHRMVFNSEVVEYFSPSVLPDFGSHIDSEILIKVVEELPAGYRTIFLLNVVDGFSHKEIAEQLGISENTSRSQLFKARRLLEKKFENLLSIEKVG